MMRATGLPHGAAGARLRVQSSGMAFCTSRYGVPVNEPPQLHTDRLTLRPFALTDAEFVVRLLNEPGFVRFIGDRGVRDLDAARRYLREGPLASYQVNGFGLLLVAQDGEPIGMCGLLQRATLAAPDLGYAFLASATGQGLASEAAQAVLAHGDAQGIARVLAIVTPDNARSIAVLDRAGFARAGLTVGEEDGRELLVFERVRGGG